MGYRRQVDLKSLLDVKKIVKLGGMLVPFATILGLLLLWALLVIVVLNFGPAAGAFLGGKILVH